MCFAFLNCHQQLSSSCYNSVTRGLHMRYSKPLRCWHVALLRAHYLMIMMMIELWTAMDENSICNVVCCDFSWQDKCSTNITVVIYSTISIDAVRWVLPLLRFYLQLPSSSTWWCAHVSRCSFASPVLEWECDGNSHPPPPTVMRIPHSAPKSRRQHLVTHVNSTSPGSLGTVIFMVSIDTRTK